MSITAAHQALPLLVEGSLAVVEEATEVAEAVALEESWEESMM